MTNNISLYFHLPFCVKKCDYCAFYSLADQGEAIKDEYLQALFRQVSCFQTLERVTSIYFGGGTPTVFGVDRLCKLLHFIRRRFILTDDCEITVEVNPKTVDKDGLLALYEAGFNRLSVGVQSANDEILAQIGRIHTFADAQRCIEDAHSVGFTNVSADVIFALPSLTVEILNDTLQKIMSTGVNHISAYSLQLEEGTPLYARRETLALPTEDEEEEQYSLLCDVLKRSGFTHYEVSTFCNDGRYSRHNLAYWFRRRYFGFGASAHSFYNGRRFSNVADVNRYIELTRDGLFEPTDYFSSPRITEREAVEEKIMLALRTYRGAIIPESAIPYAKTLADSGFGTLNNTRLVLNSAGWRVSNTIIAEIIDRI